MAKTNRREISKRLNEAIAACTDPEQLIKLTRQFAKIQPKPSKRGSRKPAASVQPTKQVGRPLRAIYTGSAFEYMSDGDLVAHHLVLQMEKRQRETGGLRTRAEREIVWEELKGSLSERDRAALEALGAQ
jgi:hypothetical protein